MTMAAIERLEDLGPGDVGAWVRLPDGTVGQVWAKGGLLVDGFSVTMSARPPKGCHVRYETARASVWVVDGYDYLEVPVADLALADEQPDTGGLW